MTANRCGKIGPNKSQRARRIFIDNTLHGFPERRRKLSEAEKTIVSG